MGKIKSGPGAVEHFYRLLEAETERAKQNNRPFALLFIGIDNYDKLLGRIGESTIRQVVAQCGRILAGNVRRIDVAIEIENGKFGFLCPGIRKREGLNSTRRLWFRMQGAIEMAERLRCRLESEEFNVDGTPVRITVSVGIVVYDGEDTSMVGGTLKNKALSALKSAHEKGGNRVEASAEPRITTKLALNTLRWLREAEQAFRIWNIEVDVLGYTVKIDGKSVHLTPKEFGLLCLLIRRRGQVLTRDYLVEQVWGYEYVGTTRTVDMHVARLRRKLGLTEKKLITLKSVGYKLAEEE